MRSTFPLRWRNEADNWTSHGEVFSMATIERIQEAFRLGPVIVEHWHYRGGTAPSRCVFEEWEDLEHYLDRSAFAGDAIDVWSFSQVCVGEKRVAQGKFPAEDGTVPQGGAY
jgi:hypothetical protein